MWEWSWMHNFDSFKIGIFRTFWNGTLNGVFPSRDVNVFVEIINWWKWDAVRCAFDWIQNSATNEWVAQGFRVDGW